MIPRRLTKDITIYPRWTSLLTGKVKPMRRVLRRCNWDSTVISTTLSTGQIIPTPTIITIWKQTSGLIYIPKEEWAELHEDELDGFWTVEQVGANGTIIAPFESDYEFSWASTTGAATTQENAFLRDNPGAIRAQKEENNQSSGGEKGAHYLIMGGN